MYVLYDPMTNAYLNQGKPVKSWREAKQYKLLGAATSPVSGAGLMNVSRNIPPGVTNPSPHYQQLPNIEVHELSDNGYFLRRYAAPPSYITL